MALYFIAINPDQKTCNEIRLFQQEMADKFESSRQLRIPVHITLIPPFEKEDFEEEELISYLQEFTDKNDHFDLQTNNFGHFDKRVIFVGVEKSDQLNELYLNLREYLIKIYGDEFRSYHPSYHPHLTIANKGLTTEKFSKAWKYFNLRNYHSKFEVNDICLYKHDGKRWQVNSILKLK